MGQSKKELMMKENKYRSNLAKVNTYGLTDVNTTENGQTICKTDLDNLSMQME